MSKKEIKMYDIEIKFRVRVDSHGAYSKKELLSNIKNGIGCNDMNCIEAEDVEVKANLK